MADEKRLIDAKPLMQNGWHLVKVGESNRFLGSMSLADIPTVDAVEVVHGRWEIIPDDYFDLVEMKCSVCGESWGFEDYEDCIPQNYHYCPNCGAKMDGERRADG